MTSLVEKVSALVKGYAAWQRTAINEVTKQPYASQTLAAYEGGATGFLRALASMEEEAGSPDAPPMPVSLRELPETFLIDNWYRAQERYHTAPIQLRMRAMGVKQFIQFMRDSGEQVAPLLPMNVEKVLPKKKQVQLEDDGADADRDDDHEQEQLMAPAQSNAANARPPADDFPEAPMPVQNPVPQQQAAQPQQQQAAPPPQIVYVQAQPPQAQYEERPAAPPPRAIAPPQIRGNRSKQGLLAQMMPGQQSKVRVRLNLPDKPDAMYIADYPEAAVLQYDAIEPFLAQYVLPKIMDTVAGLTTAEFHVSLVDGKHGGEGARNTVSVAVPQQQRRMQGFTAQTAPDRYAQLTPYYQPDQIAELRAVLEADQVKKESWFNDWETRMKQMLAQQAAQQLQTAAQSAPPQQPPTSRYDPQREREREQQKFERSYAQPQQPAPQRQFGGLPAAADSGVPAGLQSVLGKLGDAINVIAQSMQAMEHRVQAMEHRPESVLQPVAPASNNNGGIDVNRLLDLVLSERSKPAIAHVSGGIGESLGMIKEVVGLLRPAEVSVDTSELTEGLRAVGRELEEIGRAHV